MDEMLTNGSGPDPLDAGAFVPCTGTDGGAAQVALPFDRLPFDDDSDQPIRYALTARARRQVAPGALPALRVVPPAGGGPRGTARVDRRRGSIETDDADLDRPGDTRPSRARALRRGGAHPTAIARQLGVDELIVRAWLGDVIPTGRARPSDQRPDTGDEVDDPRAAEERRIGRELARAAASADARIRLGQDAGFAAGVGLLSGLAVIDEYAITITTADIDLAARVVDWLHVHAGVGRSDLRVVIRLGAEVAGDLVRHRWASTLGVPLDRVVPTRWYHAPAPDAVEALLRVPDPDLAVRISGWCDALLHPDPIVDDLAF